MVAHVWRQAPRPYERAPARVSRFQNKGAIRTGATQGIGLGIAERFVKEGARVVACARNSNKPRSEEDWLVDVIWAHTGVAGQTVGIRVDLERVVDDTSGGSV
jgi:NAD(P)-dependent dehydrogenase (short-subunit alcohol dehydrogenase family)